jgi:hypothetical protein
MITEVGGALSHHKISLRSNLDLSVAKFVYMYFNFVDTDF